MVRSSYAVAVARSLLAERQVAAYRYAYPQADCSFVVRRGGYCWAWTGCAAWPGPDLEELVLESIDPLVEQQEQEAKSFHHEAVVAGD